MMKLVAQCLALSLAAVVVGCEPHPALPPEDTMTVDFSSLTKEGALVDSTKRTHWNQSVVRVGLLNAWVGVGLAAPVLTFRAALAQTPSREGETWVWSYEVHNQNVDASATLTATPEGAGYAWALRLDGKVGQQSFADFLWFEGRGEGNKGFWQFHDHEGKTIRIDWRRDAPLDRQLTFTNVSGKENDGDVLDYLVDGEFAQVAYDFKDPKDAEIRWSLKTKEGYILADDFVGHEKVKACWSADLFDAECPAP